MGVTMFESIIKYLLLFVFIGWLTISPMIFAYWHFIPQLRDDFIKSHETIAQAVYLGAFLTGFIIISTGLEHLLFFVPESWGWLDGDGEYIQLKWFLSFIVGFFVMGYLGFLLEQYDNHRKQNQLMRIELSAYRKITPRSELIKCYQQRLEELEQHSYFSPDEEQEKEILKHLLSG
ncbi:MAG: hypothetical protein A2W76_05285 [Gammaproteobacteria bacterium RIFCSPLOWO2_12_47_11]|nr:MAG: hypothetical protein A2W76_05285 [Gammaproteobacteria bacterium RIFCSPLOWO2_12_47_11]